jgi:hypothetical protein
VLFLMLELLEPGAGDRRVKTKKGTYRMTRAGNRLCIRVKYSFIWSSRRIRVMYPKIFIYIKKMFKYVRLGDIQLYI